MISAGGFRNDIAEMMAKREKIQAVKAIKDFYGIGLKESKDLMDSIKSVNATNLFYEVDTAFDKYEASVGGFGPASSPTAATFNKPSGDVNKLAETLSAMLWEKLEAKIEEAITESVSWDIQQVRNELSVVLQEVRDLAHGQ